MLISLWPFAACLHSRKSARTIGRRRRRVRSSAALTTALLFANASASRAAQQPEASPESAAALARGGPSEHANDPWEGFNRKAYAVSDWLDHVAIGPLTHAYMHITPPPVRVAVGRFVSNLREPRTVLNDLAQAHPRLAGKAASRFVVNTTIGLGGFLDPAASMDLARRPADFGQTLGRYGVGPGPYLYVPILGPLDLRDGFGRLIDAATDPVSLLAGGATTAFGATRLAVSAFDSRSNLDAQLGDVSAEAGDPYATIRSAYSQRRAYLVSVATGRAETLPDFEAPPDHVGVGKALQNDAVATPTVTATP